MRVCVCVRVCVRVCTRLCMCDQCIALCVRVGLCILCCHSFKFKQKISRQTAFTGHNDMHSPNHVLTTGVVDDDDDDDVYEVPVWGRSGTCGRVERHSFGEENEMGMGMGMSIIVQSSCNIFRSAMLFFFLSC